MILDGYLHTELVCHLHTLLDASRKLTLPSGEILQVRRADPLDSLKKSNLALHRRCGLLSGLTVDRVDRLMKKTNDGAVSTDPPLKIDRRSDSAESASHLRDMRPELRVAVDRVALPRGARHRRRRARRGAQPQLAGRTFLLVGRVP